MMLDEVGWGWTRFDDVGRGCARLDAVGRGWAGLGEVSTWFDMTTQPYTIVAMMDWVGWACNIEMNGMPTTKVSFLQRFGEGIPLQTLSCSTVQGCNSSSSAEHTVHAVVVVVQFHTHAPTAPWCI